MESQPTLKLYKITCLGMHAVGNRVAHGIGYVVAKNSGEAYMKLRDNLDKENLGFVFERELEKIELIAEDIAYPDCGYKLYI